MGVISVTIRDTTIVEYSEAQHRLVIIKSGGLNHIYDKEKEGTLCGDYLYWGSIKHTKEESTCISCNHLLNKELKTVV